MNTAMSHRPWTFDPVAFHRWLEEQIVEDGQVRFDKLLQLARGIVENASSVAWEALEFMRFDEENLEMPAPGSDEYIADRWYMFALAPWLVSAPSLPSYGVLKIVLPLAGWSDEDVRALNFGQQLGSLPSTYGNDVVAAEFGSTWEYGWLDLIDAEEMSARLTEIRDLIFSPPQEGMEEFVDWAELISRDPSEMLTMAYHTTQEMLLTAIERRQALFLVLDQSAQHRKGFMHQLPNAVVNEIGPPLRCLLLSIAP
jgi:hypothetical protein